MAETKQEKQTFKWGDSEYLLDDLLKLHAEQEQNFYNFAKAKGSYDDAALTGLRSALTNRINAAKSGKTFSADGLLDTDTVDNTSIQTQKRGLFKKEKYVEQDNTEWAKYYLNKLVGQLKPYQQENKASSKDWDISKHGFEAYLKGQGLDARDVFEKYDLRDENNPDAARSYTQRDEQLRKHLSNYKTWLENKGFDFTKNDNEWDDNYMSTLDSVINGDWNDRTALAASLRKLGSGNYAVAFTSDKWDLSKSDEELTEEAKKRKEEADAKQKQIYMDEFENFAYDNRRSDNPIYYKGYDGDFSMDWYGDLNSTQQSEYGTYLGRNNQAWTNAWTNLMNSLKSGKAYSDKNAGVLLQGTFLNQNHGFIDLGDGKYLIRDSVTDNGQGTVYDPNTGYTNTVFLGDLAGNNAEIQNIYRQLAYKYANNKYGTKYEDRPDVLRDGGELIPKHQYGNAVVFNWESSNKDTTKEKAKENNLSPEVQKAHNRYIDSDNKSIDNPDAGFTGAEVARLASIGADITSMFLDPITGTAVGLGSTLTNFGADIADDGFQWQDVKNLGINVGFDLLGAIPIFGDAVGTGTKITRNLIKWAPRMMGILAGYQGVKNFGGMMESWQKMISNDENAKMTVQDWRNIAQSISLVTGGVRATRNKIAQNKMKNAARVDGVVGVNVYNKRTQQMERVLVDGDTAKNIRNAKSAKDVEAELNKLDDFKDKFGESGTLEVATGMGGLQKPWEKVTDADGKTSRQLRSIFSDGKAQVTDVYDFSRVNGTHGDIAKWLSTKGTPTIENNQKGKMSSEAFDAKQKELLDQAGVEAQVGKVKDAVEARKKYLEQLKGRITDTEGELVAAKQQAGGDDFVARQADAETRLSGLPSRQAVNDAQAIVTARKKFIDTAKQKRQALADSRQKQIADMEAGLNARLETMNKTLNRLKSRKKTLEDRQAKGPLSQRLATELSNLPRRIQDVQKSIRNTKSEIGTNTARIKSIHGKKRAQLKSDIKTAKGEIATATPVANQSKDVASVVAQRNAAISGQELQRRLNTLQGRQASRDPATSHTQAYRDLENMLNNLRTNNPNIGSRAVNWDMDAILQRYGVNASDVFKSGGSINRNKINKFLSYAKR